MCGDSAITGGCPKNKNAARPRELGHAEEGKPAKGGGKHARHEENLDGPREKKERGRTKQKEIGPKGFKNF
jgi:hypothetical protein